MKLTRYTSILNRYNWGKGAYSKNDSANWPMDDFVFHLQQDKKKAFQK
jgi:hypothetical protein